MNNVWLQGSILVLAASAICIIAVLFLLDLRKALLSVDEENRPIKPRKVWLSLIPFVGCVWMFVIVKAIYLGMLKQFAEFGVYGTSLKSIYQIGMAMNIISVLYFIPFLRVYVVAPMVVLWILYWIKLNRKRKELQLLADTIGKAETDSIFAE